MSANIVHCSPASRRRVKDRPPPAIFFHTRPSSAMHYSPPSTTNHNNLQTTPHHSLMPLATMTSQDPQARPAKKQRLSSSPAPPPISPTSTTPASAANTDNTLKSAAQPGREQYTTANELTSANPDTHISVPTALAFWSSQTPDDDGVLCGLARLSKPDLTASHEFLTSLRRTSKTWSLARGKFPRVVDCGAGVGRITLGLLGKVADVVDIVEPVEKFTAAIGLGERWAPIVERGGVGRVYNVGLEDWDGPREAGEDVKYGLIWNQWCLSQLTDEALVKYLVRSKEWLLTGGWIIVKENISADPEGRDMFDPEDSSVRRTDEKFRKLFAQAGCVLVKSRLQRGFPTGILPVRMYALQPEA